MMTSILHELYRETCFYTMSVYFMAAKVFGAPVYAGRGMTATAAGIIPMWSAGRDAGIVRNFPEGKRIGGEKSRSVS